MAPRDRDRDTHERLLRRIVLSIMGREGHGKTDFYLTAPQPLLVLSVDPNTEDVVCKAFEADTIKDVDPEICRLVHIPYPLVGFEADEKDIMDEALDSWDLLTDEISDVLHHRGKIQPQTVALDTGTELHTLNILKAFGRTDKLSPQMRRNRMGAVNNDFKGIFRALEHAQVHVCVTHRVKEHWESVTVEKVRGSRSSEEEKDQVVPGVFDRIGFKEIGNICNTEILVKFDPDREGELADRFGMEILRSMQRPGIIGDRYWGTEPVGREEVRAASFPFLGTLLYPTTTVKDWR